MFVIRECLVPFEQMRSENKARDSEMYDYRNRVVIAIWRANTEMPR